MYRYILKSAPPFGSVGHDLPYYTIGFHFLCAPNFLPHTCCTALDCCDMFRPLAKIEVVCIFYRGELQNSEAGPDLDGSCTRCTHTWFELNESALSSYWSRAAPQRHPVRWPFWPWKCTLKMWRPAKISSLPKMSSLTYFYMQHTPLHTHKGHTVTSKDITNIYISQETTSNT